MTNDAFEESYSFSLDHQMANNLLPPVRRPEENTIVSVNDKAPRAEPDLEAEETKEESKNEVVMPVSITKSLNNVAEIPEASEAEEGPQSSRKDDTVSKWDRNSKMPPQMFKRWFGKHNAQEISFLFKNDLVSIGQGNLDHWQQDRMGKLATIIMCDQFSRSIYKGFAEAFSFDHISLRLSKEIIGKIELFKSYALFEKLFIVLPLMHSE